MSEEEQSVPSGHQAIHQLRTGKIRVLLTQYSIPAVIATTTASLYNMIDRIFIGHGVGAMAIAGLALTLPMMNMAAAFGSLVGAGGGTLVSIRLGERRRDEAERILGNTIFLNLVLGLGYTLLCFAFLTPILRLIGASQETLPYARQFMQIILAGNVFTHLYLGLTNITRASGHPRRAMMNTLETVAINLVLAPIFIFVFHWGIRGAALATVLAQMTGALLAFPHFLKKESTIRFYRTHLRPCREIIHGIFSVGMSNFAIMFCSSMIAVLYNMRLSRYGGDYAVGAFGIVNTLLMLFAMISMGINQGMQPIAGYNFGARQLSRVRAVHRDAVVGTSCVMICGFLLGELFPHLLAGAFTGNPRLIAETVTGMRLTVLLFPLDGFQMTTSTFFQSIGKAKISLLLSLSRQVFFLIPCLIILPWHFGVAGIWIANPVADGVAFFTTLLIFKLQARTALAQ